MKLTRIIVLTCIAAALAVLLGSGATAEKDPFSQWGLTPEEAAIISEIGEERFLREGASNKAYNRLLASFSSDPLTDGSDYPEYYGGAYIDDDGFLVVNVTVDNEAIREEIRTIAGSEEIRFRRVPCSYAGLIAVMHELEEVFQSTDDRIRENVCGFGLDQEYCCVRVCVRNMDAESTDEIRKLTDHPEYLVFVQSRGIITEETAVNAGSATSNASIAYRARAYYDGAIRDGVVTAGHAVSVGGYLYTPGSVAFAQCVLRGLGGSMDSAFCIITDSNYVPSNTIDGTTNQLSTSTFNPAQGATVLKRGQSTALTVGEVVCTAGTYNYNNVVYSNLTFATYDSQPGDSGGIVYTIESGIRYTVGVHRGRWDSNAVYVKASVQNSVLGITRY